MNNSGKCIFYDLKMKYVLYSRKCNLYVDFTFFAEGRQRGRFAGFSVYVSATGDIHNSTLCYKDGPLLPPLNFTTTCVEHGRYVIFYNERRDGDIYPDDYQLENVFNELCEVVVLGIIIVLVVLSFYFFAKIFYALITPLWTFTYHYENEIEIFCK